MVRTGRNDPSRARRAWTAALALLLGALLARVPGCLARARAPAASVRLWCADRAAGRLLGLDAALVVRREVAVACPIRVAAAPGGGVWVVADRDGRAGGDGELLLFDAAGAAVVREEIAACVDLASGPDGTAHWIERGEGRDAVLGRCRPDGAVARLVVPGAQSVAASGAPDALVLVGTGTGELLLLDPARHARAARARSDLGAPVVQVAPGPEPGWWWAVTELPAPGGRGAALALVTPALAVRWSRPLPGPGSIAPVPGERLVWWLAAGGRRARRVVPIGGDEPEVHSPLLGFGRGTALAGRCVAPVPGAVLSWTHAGEWDRFQGGLDYAVEVSEAVLQEQRRGEERLRVPHLAVREHVHR